MTHPVRSALATSHLSLIFGQSTITAVTPFLDIMVRPVLGFASDFLLIAFEASNFDLKIHHQPPSRSYARRCLRRFFSILTGERFGSAISSVDGGAGEPS